MRAGYGTRVGILGGYQGGLYRGSTPSHPAPREDGPMTAKRAPEAPQGLEWVVMGSGRVSWGDGGRGGSCTTPAGPGRSLRALPVQDP